MPSPCPRHRQSNQLPCAAFSAAILDSILPRAARIISSRLRCSDDCRSSLFELHPLPFLSPPPKGAFSFPSSLYRVIKSGCGDFSGVLVAGPALALGVDWPGAGAG